MKVPAIEAITEDGVGKVPSGARRLLKRRRARMLRRYARLDWENTKPKAVNRGWYW